MKAKPDTSIIIKPKTMWWMCIPPGVTLPGHHETSARIIRTLKRMNRNVRTKASRRKNSGSLPVSTTVCSNQDRTASTLAGGELDQLRSRRVGQVGTRQCDSDPRQVGLVAGNTGKTGSYLGLNFFLNA